MAGKRLQMTGTQFYRTAVANHCIKPAWQANDADCDEVECIDDLSHAGFRMMEKFGLVEKEYGTIPGVSLEPGSFNSFPCYRLHRDALVSQPTK